MGTVFEIEAYGPSTERTAQAIEESFAAIRRADEVMSHYREESDLSRLNREGASGFVPVDGGLLALLRAAQQLTRETAGAFDITANSLGAAWKQAEQRGTPLSEVERDAARSLLGADRLQFDESSHSVRFDRSGVSVDLGAIAKGWAVDRAAEILARQGIRSALINAGSSTLYALGAPPNQPAWKIGVRDPRRAADDPAAALLGVVELRDNSLSTSASSERYFEIQGRRYSHVLDPRTAMPAEALLSATVVAPTATESDALSTAVFVLGATAGPELLRARNLGGLLAEPEAPGQPVSLQVIRPQGSTLAITPAQEIPQS